MTIFWQRKQDSCSLGIGIGYAGKLYLREILKEKFVQVVADSNLLNCSVFTKKKYGTDIRNERKEEKLQTKMLTLGNKFDNKF